MTNQTTADPDDAIGHLKAMSAISHIVPSASYTVTAQAWFAKWTCADSTPNACPGENLEQCPAADERLFAALESLTRQTLWLGGLGAAERRFRRLLQLSPTGSSLA